jgi:formylglycine-generating enzyme required for sulfatase activity
MFSLSAVSTAQDDEQNTEPGTVVQDRIGAEMVYAPAATFVVGIDQDRLLELCEGRGETNAERCVQIIEEDTGSTYTYTVDIPAFWIDRYEVTIQEFDEHCIASVRTLLEPCADPISNYRPELAENPQQPRVGVSWERAMMFCSARGARLPTEAE